MTCDLKFKSNMNSKEEEDIAKWDSETSRNVIPKLCSQTHVLVVAVQPCPKIFTNTRFWHYMSYPLQLSVCKFNLLKKRKMTAEELTTYGFRLEKTTINPWWLLPKFMLGIVVL